MRPDEPQNPLPTIRRRRLWPLLLTLFMVVLAVAWAAAWFGLRHAAEQGLARFIAGQARRGVAVECPQPLLGGFPLAIGVDCAATRVRRAGDDFAVSSVRASAPLWRPGRLDLAMESPLEAEIAGNGSRRLVWDRLSASLSVSPLDLAKLARAPAGTGVGPLDISFEADTLAVERDIEELLAPVSLRADLRLNEMAMRPPPGFNLVEHLRAHGVAGEIRALELAPAAGGRLTAIGSFAIGGDGVLDGRFEVGIADLPAIARFLAAALREDRRAADTILQAAGLLQATGFGQREGRLKLAVKRGAVSAGIIPLGRIPPLF